jgi:hypothetical protein
MRRVWVALGAERSRFGYPTADARRGPGSQWGDFQNDVLYFEGAVLRTPATAGLTRAQVSNAVRNLIRARLASDVTIDRVEILEVSNTGYDFSQTRNRLVTVRLKGKYDAWRTFDPSYSMDLQILFFAQEASGSTSLRVRLVDSRWTVTDPNPFGTGGTTLTLRSRLKEAVDRFAPSVKLIDPDIPAVVSVLSFKVLADGGLKLFLPPDGGGALVQLAVQRAFDQLAR